MSSATQRIAQEVDELVATAEKLSSDAAQARSELGPERVAELMSVVSRGGQIIRRLYGESSQYKANLDQVLETENFTSMHANWWRHIAVLVGLLKGIQSDIRSGMTENIRSLLQAEIFSDFLEMAEHLLDNGYKDPAAVLLGAVLEDSLRKLAVAGGIPTDGPTGKPLTMDPLNVAVSKSGVYGPLIQKQVTSWANLRNDAAHGNFSNFDADQVRHMLLFVQKFCSDHLQ